MENPWNKLRCEDEEGRKADAFYSPLDAWQYLTQLKALFPDAIHVSGNSAQASLVAPRGRILLTCRVLEWSDAQRPAEVVQC